jgi:protein gp37
MADHTAIEWTDATWNPITGCSVVSPGCTNCYAMRLAGTRMRHHPSRAGLTIDSKAGPVWTGEVRFNADWLSQPLRWRRPRRIFVCAHGDLFHDGVPESWIDRVFTVMALAPRHSFQVLTKRSARAAKYLSDPDLIGRLLMTPVSDHPSGKTGLLADFIDYPAQSWLPNVWIGFSAEDQPRFDARWQDLAPIAEAGWLTWCSAEPLLGPIDASAALAAGLRWVVAGGESGASARPAHPDWFRSLRDQCKTASVAFLFKQWGEWAPTSGIDVYAFGPAKNEREHPDAPGIAWLKDGRICLQDFSVREHSARIRDGVACCKRAIEVDHAALGDFYATLDSSSAPKNPLGLQWMYRIGKAAAGRLLDGVLHDGYPQA